MCRPELQTEEIDEELPESSRNNEEQEEPQTVQNKIPGGEKQRSKEKKIGGWVVGGWYWWWWGGRMESQENRKTTRHARKIEKPRREQRNTGRSHISTSTGAAIPRHEHEPHEEETQRARDGGT